MPIEIGFITHELTEDNEAGRATGWLPGRLSAKDLAEAAKKNGGVAEFKTVEGEILKVEAKGTMLTIWDAKGGMSKVTIQNVFQSNGVIHVIDTVLLPM